MEKIVGIQFQKNGKLVYFDTNHIDIKAGDYVIAETAHGPDLGEVVMAPRELEEGQAMPALKKLIRAATEQDIQHSVDNRNKEKEAYAVCHRKIAEHKLEMKLVSVEYAFDNSKIMFYFTANGRVDFRSLVKDLASVFKMRIELRQIGVRDEAKMLGGLGPCGRPICCGSFLEEFQPVSIKMAKEQNLSLNPTKISGVCGRLMCCLKYEQDHYEMTRKKMPRVGREVVTPDGTGTVTELNILKETVFVRLVNGDTSEIKEYPLDMISSANEKSHVPAHEPTRTKGPDKEDNNEKDDSVTDSKETIPEGEKRKREQNDRKQKQRPALGQPVKRENPNKSQKVKESADAGAQEPGPQKQNDGKGPESKSTAWAQAVEKAMKAIDKES